MIPKPCTVEGGIQNSLTKEATKKKSIDAPITIDISAVECHDRKSNYKSKEGNFRKRGDLRISLRQRQRERYDTKTITTAAFSSLDISNTLLLAQQHRLR